MSLRIPYIIVLLWGTKLIVYEEQIHYFPLWYNGPCCHVPPHGMCDATPSNHACQ